MQITIRSSHFRMVEMADFMTYLDTAVARLDSHVFLIDKLMTMLHNEFNF